jgi:hypothetical protein
MKIKDYHYIALRDSALTKAEKIRFIERVYNAKVIETKLIKSGHYYFIEAIEDIQRPATLDYYYLRALKLELNSEH